MKQPVRNQPCPCGSGKKFKHCCGKHATPLAPMVAMPDGATVPTSTAISIAMEFHKGGKVKKAAEIYQRILCVESGHADALHLLGLAEYQLGNHTAAFEMLTQAMKIRPDAGIFHNNFGKVLRALGRTDEAIASYQRAQVLQPDFPEVHFNLGEACKLQNRLSEAAEYLEQAVYLKPDYTEAIFALGAVRQAERKFDAARQCFARALDLNPNDPFLYNSVATGLRLQGQLEEAAEHIRHAIALKPEHLAFYYSLAVLLTRQGKYSEAEEVLLKVLELDPGAEVASHLLNGLRNEATELPPAGYVRDLFDQYADHFDKHLVEVLDYQTPQRMAEIIRPFAERCGGGGNGIDLGCGTGLLGVHIRPFLKRLAGVDLSPKMIECARERGIYDELAADDLIGYMERQDEASYDLAAAADVLVYLGNLAPVFELSRRILKEGGRFFFSIEECVDLSRDYVLAPTGRYQHSLVYVRRLAEQMTFLESCCLPTVLRKEGEAVVRGYIFCFEKIHNQED